MKKCNVIIRRSLCDEEIISVLFDIKNVKILIEENKNLRWIQSFYKTKIVISYKDWISKDISKYEVITDVDFIGDENLNKCYIIKTNTPLREEFIGVLTNMEDYNILLSEYDKQRWLKYMNFKINKELINLEEDFESILKSKIFLSFEEFVSLNPCKVSIIENALLKS
jgi:hypothetical protein